MLDENEQPHMLPETLNPLSGDIIIQHVDMNKVEDTSVILNETSDNQNQYFQVIKTASDVTEVSVGNIVMIPWGRITLPFMLDDGKKYGITSQDEVVAIMEGVSL